MNILYKTKINNYDDKQLNAICLLWEKLRFQNIYNLSNFLASKMKNLETAYFKYKVHTKKKQISVFLSLLHWFLVYPRKYFFRNIRYFYMFWTFIIILKCFGNYISRVLLTVLSKTDTDSWRLKVLSSAFAFRPKPRGKIGSWNFCEKTQSPQNTIRQLTLYSSQELISLIVMFCF